MFGPHNVSVAKSDASLPAKIRLASEEAWTREAKLPFDILLGGRWIHGVRAGPVYSPFSEADVTVLDLVS